MRRVRQGDSSRTVRRAARHWPPLNSPAVVELLGGRSPRQLTRAQRQQIVDLIERFDLEDRWFRAEVRAIVEETERPTRRLQRLIRVNKNLVREALETKQEQ